jgi:anaerobic selenocysteine-containing dehydrogenase
LNPVSDNLRSEPEILASLAKAVLGVNWNHLISNYDHIRDLIQQVVPGFDDYNQRLRQPGGFYLPNVARSGQFIQGKASFSKVDVPQSKMEPGEFLMMTIRSHDQFNTTVYGNDDRYRGILNERRVVLMNPEDMAEAGLKEAQVVNLTSCYHGVTREVRNFKLVPYSIPRKNVATYFPEANPLIPVNLVARGSHTPCSKSVKIRVTPSE